MLNSSHAKQRCRQQEPQYQAGYRQALADFALTDLLHCIKTYSDEDRGALTTHEIETLAATLIQILTASLDNSSIASCLYAIHQSEASVPPIQFHSLPTCTNLPSTFPDVEIPRFLYGDRLCWIAHDDITDWGIVIGRFYSFAPHRCGWQWCYLIWLDGDSPSNAWVNADIAWEDDLEPLEMEPIQ